MGLSTQERGTLRALEPTAHHVTINQSCLLEDELAIAEDGEVRDASHVVACAELGATLGVDLQDHGAPGEIMCDVLHHGRGHSARAAPLRPEIDEHRYGRVMDDAIELGGVDVDGRGGGRQLGLTTAALSGMREVSGWNAVVRAAPRAFPQLIHAAKVIMQPNARPSALANRREDSTNVEILSPSGKIRHLASVWISL